jgi:uncharacterized RDD family membrane protein YckC
LFCPKCGAAISSGTAFCGNCGNSVAQPAIASPSTYPVNPPASSVSPYSGVAGFHNTQNFPFADFWPRFLAHLIDGLILGAACMIILVPFFFLTGASARFANFPRHPDPNAEAAFLATFFFIIIIFVIISVLLQWLYFAYLESGEKQATWGKQAMGMYVTDMAGQRITFGRASGRFFAKIVSGLVPFFIGYIMAAFTARKQALHDMIANTLVLKR